MQLPGATATPTDTTTPGTAAPFPEPTQAIPAAIPGLAPAAEPLLAEPFAAEAPAAEPLAAESFAAAAAPAAEAAEPTTPLPGAAIPPVLQEAAAAAAAPAATVSNASSSVPTSFPGYPESAGLLSPALLPLLVAIQEARLYNDSKTAVDLVLKGPPEQVAAAYYQLLAAQASNVSSNSNASSSNASSSSNVSSNAAALQAFVDAHLDPAGSDLEQCTASDWQPEPPGFLTNLTAAAAAAAGNTTLPSNDTAAPQLRQFGLAVHALWRVLCRQVSPSVSLNPERHSLLPLPNRTVVPGGGLVGMRQCFASPNAGWHDAMLLHPLGDRFRETYYWDSYWVLRGLLVSHMHDTAGGLLGNLLAMLERVGHVPNGGRVYYLNRSQPPLLSAMVRDVYEAAPANNSQLLQRALPLLLAEHAYWTTPPKAVQVRGPDGAVYNLSRYWADWFQPRPESYREDAALALNVTGSSSPEDPGAARLYHELASGAESGWDYSSRWFGDGQNLGTIRTTQIVPADLNAWLYQMEQNIAWAANISGDAATSDAFNKTAAARKVAIQALLWDEAAAMWRDGILSPINATTTTNISGLANTTANSTQGGPEEQQLYSLAQNPGVFASNFVPLWAGLTEGDEVQGAAVVAALQNSSLVGPSGIATTLYPTGQQWDYPNGWPPLQHMIITGASRYGGAPGDAFAAQMARTWVMMNMNVFNATGHMHEKYDVSQPGGVVGGGGEYSPQVGFGWSNGVVLDLLALYF